MRYSSGRGGFSIAALRPSLMRAVRSAVDSGDTLSARRLYGLLNGPRAAAALDATPQAGDVLDTVGHWLSRQSDVGNDLTSH